MLFSACEPQHSTSAFSSNSNNVTGGSGGSQNTDNSNSCNGCCNGCNQAPVCSSVITVVDEQGVPIKYAEVMVYGGTQVNTYFTDVNGQILALGLKNGNYILKVTKTGYDDETKTLTVKNNTCPVLDMIMTPPQGPLTCIPVITVNDSASPYAAISNADVNINGMDYHTNASGVASIAPGLEDGDYPYSVTATGYNEVSGFYVISDNICPNLTISPSATPCTVSFLIDDASKPWLSPTPVAGQLVSFTLDTGTPKSYTTDQSGVITLSPAVAPGSHTYSVSYTSGGYTYLKTGSFSFTAGNCPNTITVDTTTTTPLECTAMFTVTDAATSAAITGAQITINGQTYNTVNGVAYIPDLADGIYPYTISATGYTSVTGSYTVTHNTCPNWPITLNAKPCNVSFLIMYGGKPVPSQEVTFILDGNTISPDPVTGTGINDGYITIPNILPGTHTYDISLFLVTYSKGFPLHLHQSGSFSFAASDNCNLQVQTVPMLATTCDTSFHVDQNVPNTTGYSNVGVYEAVVSLYQNSSLLNTCTTDANGLCTIFDLIDGNYTYTVTIGSDVVYTNSYVVSGLDCTPVEVTLCETFFAISLPQDYGPAVGAVIHINGQDYTTNGSGEAIITDLDASNPPTYHDYPYTVDPPSNCNSMLSNGKTCQELTGTYRVSSGICSPLTLQFQESAPTMCTESFEVADSVNHSLYIAGATITLYKNGVLYGTYTTDSGGVWNVTGLTDGSYTYTVSKSGSYYPYTNGAFTISGLNCSGQQVYLVKIPT